MADNTEKTNISSIQPPIQSAGVRKLGKDFDLRYPLDLGSDQESYAAVFRIFDVTGTTIKDSNTANIADTMKIMNNVLKWGGAASVADQIIKAASGGGVYHLFNAAAVGAATLTATETANILATALHEQRPFSDSKGALSLYMPTKLVADYNFGWETADLSLLRTLTKGAINLSDSVSSGKISADGYREFYAREIGQEAIENMLSRATHGTLRGLAVASATDSRTKTVRSPYLQFLFRAVAPRKFSFDFTFAPRSAKEADEVQKIIYAFKFFSHPSMTGNDNLYLTYPAEFQISFINLKGAGAKLNNEGQQLKTVSRISRCVCTNITVDYTGHGEGVSMIENENDRTEDHPSHITLHLSFDETMFLTRKNINEGF